MKVSSDSGGNGAASGRGGVFLQGSQRETGTVLRTVQVDQQSLLELRELKNSLVGDDQAKRGAFALSVVGDLLAFLDAAAASVHYESCLLQGIGLLAILSTPVTAPHQGLAEIYLAPSGSRIVGHIIRGLEISSLSGSSGERLAATALRAISSLCVCLIPTSNVDADDAGAAAAYGGERVKSLEALTEASYFILNEIVAAQKASTRATADGSRGLCWSSNLTTLGLQTLAAITRVEELARGLVRAVVSTRAVLLAPISGLRGAPTRVCGVMLASRTERTGAKNVRPLLELLVNVSYADPHAVAAWLLHSVPGWPTGGALKGVELELNNRDEKVRIMAGLILVNCFKSSKTGGGVVRGGHVPAPFPTRLPHPTPSPGPPDLDEVIAHRVLPLFFRALRAWSTLSSAAGMDLGTGVGSGSRKNNDGRNGGTGPAFHCLPFTPPDAAAEGNGDGGFAAVCGGYAAAVASAVKASTELGSWRRQQEAVAYGAVDSLVELLRKVRTEEMATAARLLPSSLETSRSESYSSRGNTHRIKHASAHHQKAAPTPAGGESGGGDGGGSTSVNSSELKDTLFGQTVAETGLSALATLCARCEAARERTVGLGFHFVVRSWLATAAPWEEEAEREDCGGRGKRGTRGEAGGSGTLLAALSLVRNLGRSSVACSALVSAGAHESLLGMLILGGGGGGGGHDDERGGAAGERFAGGDEREEMNVEKMSGGEAKQETMAAGNAAASIDIAAAAAAERVALASASLANMALEHEVVKEAIVGSEDSLRRICDSVLDLSPNRKQVRLASIAVLKSTCFLASLHVRVKVAYFLGGVGGMLGLLQGPRDEAVLQGLYTLRNLLSGVPLRALCRHEWEATPTAGEEGGGGRGGSSPHEQQRRESTTHVPHVIGEPRGADSSSSGSSSTAAGAGGQAGGAPTTAPETGSESGDWRRTGGAMTVAAAAADEGRRPQRRDWQGWRGRNTGGGGGGRGSNDGGNSPVARRHWGTLDAPPLPSSRGRGSRRRAGGRQGYWGRGGHNAGSRSMAHDGSRYDPMDVVSQNSSEDGNGLSQDTTTTSTGTAKRGGGGGSGGDWREDTTGLDFLRLMDAVMETLRGGGGGCDETSCAALRLLQVLAAADDSQRVALRTPRVLHAAFTFFTPDSKSNSNSTSPDLSGGGCGGVSNGEPADTFMPSTLAAPAGIARGSQQQQTQQQQAQTALQSTPSVAANIAARMLLTELLPQRPGDFINIDSSSSSGGGGNSSGAGGNVPADGSGIIGGSTGATQMEGWTRGAGGQRWVTYAATGAWCSGLEFDRAAGGGGTRRPEGE